MPTICVSTARISTPSSIWKAWTPEPGISLLTGAYDYSASPDDTRRVAALIRARFCEMPELGHFPMLEDPKRLLAYLRPELAHILSVRESA